ncbi:MAG TPA: glycoside hydrolase family 88 protein [Phycisphaerae bacterium]|jgi:unsaturated chondroitin disaccharide hydrolase|nr:glucuronyl hydrolase [Phycisphaerae bacterium]HOB73814.1 glycoside hydrolase family 88 protein [Phycisphaerae bacterium]HOJ53971.1 glycoside hydrolase family 88 protein [Phycisphaerae bacterium]HOL27524.1 glycoside hydrolase family 88 protein [Phycisphaerae bacterium]HPP22620.1 glycoside hydrolase family 88 protein [Phycisphaerae bacterium]
MIPAESGDLLATLENAFDFAQRQVRRLIEKYPDYFPIYTVGGKWHHSGERWTNWCEGFLPGMMWIFFEETGDSFWREQAEHYSRLVEPRKDDRTVHDLGFLFYHGTYRRWYDATVREGLADPTIREVVFHAGRTLAKRFKEKGAYLRSFVADESLFIDIMMNVPVILYTAIETNDDVLMDIASRHCATSRRYLVRGDGSTAHEALFDTQTGECLRQTTHQGYRGDSCWSRGLAWALYGFATCGRLLNFRPWLETSQSCAQYLLEKLAGDPVPPWDFDAPEESRAQKDSSAGAIAAAGLFELSDAVVLVGTDQARQRRYLRDSALRILAALCEPEYLATQDADWEGILKHGVYHIHKGLGVDESVMWGEFFFVDALQRAIRHLRSAR